MIDRTGDWCFEGGCTYLSNEDTVAKGEPGIEEVEAMYREPCRGMYD